MTDKKKHNNNLLSISDNKNEEKPISFKSFQYSFSDSNQNVNNLQNNNDNEDLKSDRKIKEIKELTKNLIDKKQGSSDSSFENCPCEEIRIEHLKNNDNNSLVDDDIEEKEKNEEIIKQTNLINDFLNNKQKSFPNPQTNLTNPIEKEIILNPDSPSFNTIKDKNETNSVSTPLFGLDTEKINEFAVESIIKKIEPIKINMEVEGNFVEKLMKELEEADKETWGNFGAVGKKVIMGGRYNNNRKEDESEAFSYPYKDNSICNIF